MLTHERSGEAPLLTGSPTLFEMLSIEDDHSKDPLWRRKAACLGSEVDFMVHLKAEVSKAKAVCWKSCLVREDCLLFALDYEEQVGVWGGFSAQDRASYSYQLL